MLVYAVIRLCVREAFVARRVCKKGFSLRASAYILVCDRHILGFEGAYLVDPYSNTPCLLFLGSARLGLLPSRH